MFIRRVPHKNKKTHKEYHTYKLVDSIRTERGPRQRDILNLGVNFDLPKEQWKDLANCVEEIITGQTTLIDYPKEVKSLARRYAKKIIRQESSSTAQGENITPDFATVDVNSVENEESRTVGAEHVVYQTIKKLEIDRKLKEFGFNKHQLAAALGVIARPAWRIRAPVDHRHTN